MGQLTKISFNASPRTLKAIQSATEITGDNQTDVLNRSVQAFGPLCTMIAEGKRLVVEDPTTGERQRIVFL